jgi:hypothetical protein
MFKNQMQFSGSVAGWNPMAGVFCNRLGKGGARLIPFAGRGIEDSGNWHESLRKSPAKPAD